MIITTTENIPKKQRNHCISKMETTFLKKNHVKYFTQGLWNIAGGILKACIYMMIESRYTIT